MNDLRDNLDHVLGYEDEDLDLAELPRVQHRRSSASPSPRPRPLTEQQRQQVRALPALKLGRLRDLHGCQLGLSQLALSAVARRGQTMTATGWFGPQLESEVRVKALSITEVVESALSYRRAGDHVLLFDGRPESLIVPFLHRLALRHLAREAQDCGSFALEISFDEEKQRAVALFSAELVPEGLRALQSELNAGWRYITASAIASLHARMEQVFSSTTFRSAVAAGSAKMMVERMKTMEAERKGGKMNNEEHLGPARKETHLYESSVGLPSVQMWVHTVRTSPSCPRSHWQLATVSRCRELVDRGVVATVASGAGDPYSTAQCPVSPDAPNVTM